MPDNRRWVVKCPQTPISTAFPSAEAWADLAAEFEPTLPVPLLPKPLGGVRPGAWPELSGRVTAAGHQ